VLVDGAAPARSTRLEPGVMVHVELPEEKPAVEVRPQIAAGMSLIHQDDDIVVSTSPSASPRIPAPDGPGPPCSGTSPPRASASPTPVTRSDRGSSAAWTWAPAG